MSVSARAFPPYHLLERDLVAAAQRKYERLAHLYDKSQSLGWDGKKVLADLVAKEGGIRMSREKRIHVARIFSAILWGELAAWNVAADLALELEDIEAKMAATGQVFDEARHFATMREYLLLLDVELPPLDGYTQAVLRELLGTKNLVYKLLGMQLLVENVAVNLFRTMAQARVEPVLSGLMPYFERDEARHVGLGVMYLPRLLADLGPLQSARLKIFQLRITTLIIWATRLLRPHFEALGIDNNTGIRRGLRMQNETLAELKAVAGGLPRGVLAQESRREEALNSLSIDLFFPPLDATPPAWQRTMLAGLYRTAQIGDHLLKWIS